MILLNKPKNLNKSLIITFISVMQTYWTAILTFVLPLYLFSKFQSETIVWNFASAWALMSIITMMLLGFILRHVSRTIVFKIASSLLILWIILLIYLTNTSQAYIAWAFTKTAIIIIPITLSLYLRDLTKTKDLPKKQWIYVASINLAWSTWPILAWYIINLISTNKTSINSQFILDNFDLQYIQYFIPLLISILFYLIAVWTFVWWKFITKHPHLKASNEKIKTNEIHHHKHLWNIGEYFDNKKRALSFINLSFIAIWLVFILVFMPIFLKKHWIWESQIWIIMWLFFVPLVLLEWFLYKVIKICWSSLNALIVWYSIFAFFVSIAFIIWFENIYLFIALIVTWQVWISITQPLQEFMYFEWTNKNNEHRFYSLHKLWNNFFTLITPILIWMWIKIWWIDTVFRSFPFIFIFVFYFLYKFKKSEKKK